MVIDAVQANVNFNAAGTITTDLAAAQPSKNELGADYGMGKVSSIGKEWDEQAAAFASYVTGKTVAEALVSPSRRTGNAGAPTSPPPSTIGVGDFLTWWKRQGPEMRRLLPCFCPSSCWPAAHPLPRRRRRVRSGMRPPFSPSLTP